MKLAHSEPNNTSMCIWAERHKTKLPKANRTRKLHLGWYHKTTSQHFVGVKPLYKMHRPAFHALEHGRDQLRLAACSLKLGRAFQLPPELQKRRLRPRD